MRRSLIDPAGRRHCPLKSEGRPDPSILPSRTTSLGHSGRIATRTTTTTRRIITQLGSSITAPPGENDDTDDKDEGDSQFVDQQQTQQQGRRQQHVDNPTQRENWLKTVGRRILTGPFPALRRIAAHHYDHQQQQQQQQQQQNNTETTSSLSSLSSSINGFSWRGGMTAVAAYLLLGAVAYHTLLEPSWTVVDAMYFAVTCFTTVGYGDQALTSRASQTFTTVYSWGGIAFLTSVLTTMGSTLWRVEEQAIHTATERTRAHVKGLFQDMHPVLTQFRKTNRGEDISNNATVTKATATTSSTTATATATTLPPKGRSFISWNHPWLQMTRQMIWHSLPSLLIIMAGGLFLNYLNGQPWTTSESIYFGFVTASTVGFGDCAAQTQAARAFAIVFLPTAVACAGEIFSELALILADRRQHVAFERELHANLTLQHLNAMDADGSGQVTREEYVAFMLLEMGRVDQRELDELHQQFQMLDVSQSGTLGKEDLRLMAELKGTRVVEKLDETDETTDTDVDDGASASSLSLSETTLEAPPGTDGGGSVPTKKNNNPSRSDTSLKMSSSSSSDNNIQAESTSHSLVVLIPAYNEELRIGETLKSYHEFLSKSPQWNDKSSILVADDGSLDSTAAVVERVASEISALSRTTIPIECVSLPANGGKGAALAHGIKEIARRHPSMSQAAAPLILTTDADGSAPAEGIDDMYESLISYWNENNKQSTDEKMGEQPIIVAGRRGSAAISRVVFRWGFRTVVKLVCGDLGVQDSQCGFKLMTLPAAKALYKDLNLPGWSHDVEVLYRAKQLNVPVLEQATEWEDKDGSKLVASPGGVILVCAKMFGEVCKLRWGYEGGGNWKLPSLVPSNSSDD